jgi:hypothetical protein
MPTDGDRGFDRSIDGGLDAGDHNGGFAPALALRALRVFSMRKSRIRLMCKGE